VTDIGLGETPVANKVRVEEVFFRASRTVGGIVGFSCRAAFKLMEVFLGDGKLKGRLNDRDRKWRELCGRF